MHISRPLVLLLLLAGSAAAQTPPSDSTLHVPAHGKTAKQPAAVPSPAVTVKTAPRTPVVRASGNSHAEKPVAGHATPHGQTRPPAGATKPVASPAAVGATPPAAPSPPAIDPNKGSVTGYPLPRWASLRSDDVNLRSGPGTRYPIEWQYHRRDLPVRIEREFEVWRLVEDEDGVKGWVHQATLTGRRSFVVAGAERTLRSAANDDAPPVARLKPGVVGRFRDCEANAAWCEVQVSDYRGWLKRADVWGTASGEAIN
jgi:SH3-like domain-containing protein